MGRRWCAAVGLALVALLALAACSSDGSDTGSVAGRLELVGGPPPGVEQPLPGVVTAQFSDGHRVTVHVEKDGHYKIEGHAGTVKLTGRSPGYGRGKGRCTTDGGVTVKADSTVRADVLCQAM